MIIRSYDSIAGVYDKLAGIFIGKALREAQIYLLQFIPANARLLIVGGGTGWILEEITVVHQQGLAIDYKQKLPKNFPKTFSNYFFASFLHLFRLF